MATEQSGIRRRALLAATATIDTSRLVNVRSGKALDVNACGTADGADIQQWSWLNNNCQQWQLQPV